jgi:molybdopterin synthase catalytic subunit/molybdopterin converting factor small subunit
MANVEEPVAGMACWTGGARRGKQSGMAKVTVKFLGPARTLTGEPSAQFDLAAGETVGALAGRLAEKYPSLGAAIGVRLAVNRHYVPLDHALADGDEVAVIPPVSGGGPDQPVRLVREAIDVAQLVAGPAPAAAGACDLFVGTVRAEQRGAKPLAALEYDAYEDMAIEHMTAIRARAIERFGLVDAAIVHRLGRVELGEASIAVAAWSGHRAEAFEACRWIVDAIKTDVPIWKKDLWADGSTSWVEGEA